MEERLFEPVANKAYVDAGQPLARETVEIWDPIQKCKVIRYKDELLKELYKGLSVGINPTMELGA